MTVRTRAPVDSDKQLIQALGVLAGGAHQIAVGAGSLRNSSAFNADTRVIEIFSDVACYFQTGNSSVTASASDHYLPAERERVYAIGGDKQTQHTHIAVIQAAGAGTLYVSEMD